jgi:hypothetical protein
MLDRFRPIAELVDASQNHFDGRLLSYNSLIRILLWQTSRKMNEVRCTCSCGKAGLMVTGPLLGRIKCHCTICQSANQAAFADSTVMMAKHVPLYRVEHVRFETRMQRPAAQRGFCRSCGCFVLARMAGLPFLSLVFVPAARFPMDFPLPKPVMHVYYESCIADVADELPKHSGNWSSRLAVLRMVLKVRLGRVGHT